jgi:DNA polymerase V
MEKETGFPSPAQGYEEKSLDLNRILIKNSPATFIMEAEGRDMEGRGIFPGSLLVVDRSVKPHPGSVVVAASEGEFRLREVVKEKNRIFLTDQNGMDVSGAGDTVIFGTVTATINLL